MLQGGLVVSPRLKGPVDSTGEAGFGKQCDIGFDPNGYARRDYSVGSLLTGGAMTASSSVGTRHCLE